MIVSLFLTWCGCKNNTYKFDNKIYAICRAEGRAGLPVLVRVRGELQVPRAVQS